jgi:signal transduction histidine kinase
MITNSLIPILEIMSFSCIHQTNNELKEMALSNIYILQHKIKDLLDYATMEISEIKLELSEFCLNDLFDELQKLFRLEIEHKANIFIVTIKGLTSKKFVLFTDRNRLKQILIKLISNANKFTHKGIIELTAEEVKDTFNVIITVKDTGIGIDKEKLDVLFASLSQKKRIRMNQLNYQG